MTAPATEAQPDPDDRVGELYQAVTVAVLAAVGVAVSKALAGDLFGATTGLDAAVTKARTRLPQSVLHRVVAVAAARGTHRARTDLPAIGIRHLIDPGAAARGVVVSQASTRLGDAAGAVASTLRPVAQRLYRRALTAASTPGDSKYDTQRRDAAQRVLNTSADRGGIEFVDNTGRRWNADTYMRLVASTAARDTELSVNHAWLRRNGVQLVYCTTNGTACDLCKPHEGKIYSLDGSGSAGGTVDVRGLDSVQSSVPVAGSVASAVGAGLLHRHCRHSLVPWIPGVTIASDARPNEAAALERQRQAVIAAHIRHWQRRRAVALGLEQRAQAKRKLAFWSNQLIPATRLDTAA